ncbi:MAG: zf-HC2 domain-containing protein [Ignavibacteriales bacterium]|nr:zf-HC2 domain-containing protein [Ignavibacteriales bacterium]
MHDYEEKIFRLVEGDLNEKEREMLNQHIESCAECKIFLSEYTGLKRKTRNLYANVKLQGIDIHHPYRNKKANYFRKGLIYLAAAAAVIIGFVISSDKIKENPTVNSLLKDKTNPTSVVSKTNYVKDGDWNLEVSNLNRRLNLLIKEIEEKPL